MSTYIPVTTLSNLRDNFVPPSLSDLFYLQQGSEHDRDSAATLGQILESGVISSFVADNQQWKTFFTEYDEENDVCRASWVDWEKNVILRSPYAKDIRWNATIPRNALVVVIPDFTEDSDYIVISKAPVWSIQIPKGNIGVLFFNDSGNLDKFFPLPCSSSFTNAELKELTVGDLIVQSTLTLPALSILSTHIANGAVTTDKIGNGAVTTDKIGNGAVTTDKIGTGAVTPEKIATGAVTADKINTHAVETDKVKDKAITSDKLADQLAFVKTPKFPRKIYITVVVTESGQFQINPDYVGTKFSAEGSHTIQLVMYFSTADSRFEYGDTYRIYNESPGEITVNDQATSEIFTKIPAWSFKDFYYRGNAWDLA